MQTPLEAIRVVLDRAARVVILTHINPDPDAIASAVALRYLLRERFAVTAVIGYRGIIGRAENRALVRYLRRPLRRMSPAELEHADAVLLVDTQPGMANCSAGPDAAVCAVIDHHPTRVPLPPGSFVDIRPTTGATATILTEYLQTAGLPLSQALATALFYGIKSDTLGLIRGAGAADVAAYGALQPRIDRAALLTIEQAQVPVSYFQQLNAAVQAARLYDDVVIADLGPMVYPDLAAELADLLLRLEGVRWSVCLGIYEQQFILSVRTRDARGGAGQRARRSWAARGMQAGMGCSRAARSGCELGGVARRKHYSSAAIPPGF